MSFNRLYLVWSLSAKGATPPVWQSACLEDLADMYLDGIMRYHEVARSGRVGQRQAIPGEAMADVAGTPGHGARALHGQPPQTVRKSEHLADPKMKQHFVTDRTGISANCTCHRARDELSKSLVHRIPTIQGRVWRHSRRINDGSTRELTKEHHQMDACMDRLRAIRTGWTSIGSQSHSRSTTRCFQHTVEGVLQRAKYSMYSTYSTYARMTSTLRLRRSAPTSTRCFLPPEVVPWVGWLVGFLLLFFLLFSASTKIFYDWKLCHGWRFFL